MPEEFTLNLREVIETLLKYADGKGQIPDIPRFLVLAALSEILRARYGITISWAGLLKAWSPNAPVYREPLWLYVIKYLSAINQKTEVVTQLSQRKKLLGGD